MRQVSRTVGVLRVLLTLLFFGLIAAQAVILPELSAYFAEQEPDLAYLRWPMLVFAIVELVCVQVVIVCAWRLLGMVRADRIFSPAAFGWVDAIVWAMCTAWVLALGVFVYIVVTGPGPGLPILLLGMVLVGGVLVLLMVVMRALLRHATTLRTEMEAVI